MTTAKKELNADNRQFSLSAPFQFLAPPEGDTKAKRKFAGVAYSGDVISNHWYWGNVVFELASITVPDKLPALIDHSRSCRAGYVTGHEVTQEGLKMSGTLLSNEHGASVAADSDEGFPWQMSVHIDPGRIEEVMAGKEITINGRNMTGPLTVFKDSVLREVSFTATGWDSKTTATAMSRPSGGASQQPSQPTTGVTMTPEEIAALQAENASLKASKEAAEKAATDAQKAKRTTEVSALFAKIGREYKADDADAVAMFSMSDDAFAATSRMLVSQHEAAQKAAPATNAALFSHTATQGDGNGGQPPANKNPLLADAKRRAEEFARSHSGNTFTR